MEASMKEIIKKLTRGIKIDRSYLEKIEKSRKNIEYVNSLDFNNMPDEIKEANLSIIERAKKVLESVKEVDFVVYDPEYEGEDALDFASRFGGMSEMISIMKDIVCLDEITGGGIKLSEGIEKEFRAIREDREDELSKLKEQMKVFIEKAVKKEFLNEDSGEEEKQPDVPEIQQPKIRSYTIKKSAKSPQEIKEIIDEYIRINEGMFNRIIFESKPATLSISERVLDVYFKPGTGYVINFISEPDTNYGKYYQNLLKVFNEIREYMYDNHDIVVSPEDGKAISYLNSFYQNYVFVREKIDSALLQFKLQNSLLNEIFSVRNMVFEKLTGKYLIFFTGNKDLSKAVESYFQNQAKLGTMTFEPEFVEYTGDIKKTVLERLNKLKNKIDLAEGNTSMKIIRLENDKNDRSLVMNITGVKILIDPGTVYEGNDIDIVVMSNARGSHVSRIPKIMSDNPNAKLFTSDISYRVARIKWMKELNNPNIILGNEASPSYNRRDVENINEKVIRITPMGKGYNFKNLVNIKFFHSGSIPGSSAVEIMDSAQKTIYLSSYTEDDTGLLKGADNDLSQYSYIISGFTPASKPLPLPVSLIRQKLSDGKQVFIFADHLGNFQHLLADMYGAGIDKTIVAADNSFGIMNKELSKLLNFGSSWGDNFEDKDMFNRSIMRVESFNDEYEFYKKFSMSESLIFILPFEKSEIEMVLKNKIYGEHLIFVPTENEAEFKRLLENDAFVPDEYKSDRHIAYNYVINSAEDEIFEKIKDSKNLKKMIIPSENGKISSSKALVLIENTEKTVY
jgi:hypothetical protein